jgi:hypothetical protein
VAQGVTGCSEKGKTIVNIFDGGLFILSKNKQVIQMNNAKWIKLIKDMETKI